MSSCFSDLYCPLILLFLGSVYMFLISTTDRPFMMKLHDRNGYRLHRPLFAKRVCEKPGWQAASCPFAALGQMRSI